MTPYAASKSSSEYPGSALIATCYSRKFPRLKLLIGYDWFYRILKQVYSIDGRPYQKPRPCNVKSMQVRLFWRADGCVSTNCRSIRLANYSKDGDPFFTGLPQPQYVRKSRKHQTVPWFLLEPFHSNPHYRSSWDDCIVWNSVNGAVWGDDGLKCLKQDKVSLQLL